MLINISLNKSTPKTVYDRFEISGVVVDLCHKLGIDLRSYSDIEKKGFDLSPWYLNTQGLYTPSRDEIGLNEWILSGHEARRENLDCVILHEIGHWTGHSSRLARDAIVDIEDGSNIHKSLDAVMRGLGEELTAEAIMYGLARSLGVATEYHRQHFERYSNGLILLKDFNQKLRDANMGVSYVMDIFNQNQLKTA